MKAFQFPLERVLDLRRKQEQIEELRLENMLAECRRILREREFVEEKLRLSAKEVLGRRLVEPIELLSLGHFRAWTQKQILQLTKQLGEAEACADEQRVVLNDARRNVRLIENLRERRRHEWDAEFHKELEEQASESYLSRWNRERNLAGKRVGVESDDVQRVGILE